MAPEEVGHLMCGDLGAASVLQFGTGRFLRCFLDLFVHELNTSGLNIGRIVAVQSTGTERADLMNQAAGKFHAAVRGLQDGKQVDRTTLVESVGQAVAAGRQWQTVLDIARSASLRMIVSNVTEAGYALQPESSNSATQTHDAPSSFPAKLLAVLVARHSAGQPAPLILPCELIDDNGVRLRRLVLEQARVWNVGERVARWVRDECRWYNTLVDRIVSAPKPTDAMAVDDPLFAVAEPFAEWLLEEIRSAPHGPAKRIAGLEKHAAVRLVEHLEPFRLRKVRILNGAHTALVAKALPKGIDTVREAVADTSISGWLRTLLFDEILPAIEQKTVEATPFAEAVLERFANPFLDHRLADIALHHDIKLRTRLLPTYHDYIQRFSRTPALLHEIVGALA